MVKNEKSPARKNLFFSRILNNQIFVSLLMILLVLLIILVFTRIAYLFAPVVIFIDLVAFPIVMAGIFYYLFHPIVRKLMGYGTSRVVAIWLIFLFFLALIIWGVIALIPILRDQGITFINNLPLYNQQISEFISELPFDFEQFLIDSNISRYIENFDWNNITTQLNSILTSTFGGIGSVIGTVTEVVVGLIAMPVILFYLLLDGHKLPKFIVKHVPDKYRQTVSNVLYKSNYQVSRYIRGQILVALSVGVMFAIGYTLIGLDYAISLAVIAAILNIIPYLGSIIAVIPALIISLLTSPYMLIKVIIVISIEQFIEGRIVSPQVLGSNLKIHPVTIFLILLAGGRLFGVAGVILGVPGYAVVKVIFSEIYYNFRANSNLYSESTVSDK